MTTAHPRPDRYELVRAEHHRAETQTDLLGRIRFWTWVARATRRLRPEWSAFASGQVAILRDQMASNDELPITAWR